MNQDQARRLLGTGVTCVARYDNHWQRTAAWAADAVRLAGHVRAADTTALRASQQAAWAAACGSPAQLSRHVTVDALSGLLTILVPLPDGGFIVGVVERELVHRAAEALAQDLEAAIQREFGPQWAPYVAAAVAVAVFVVVIAVMTRGE